MPIILRNILTQIETYQGRNPEQIHTYNAREYTIHYIQVFLNHICTKQTTIVPHNPQMNGIAEHHKKTLVNAARCALAHSNLPASLCQFAIMDAVYIYNFLPHASANEPAAQRWYHKWIPPIHVLTFGYIGTIPDRRPKPKIEHKSRPARFLYKRSRNTI